MDDFNFGPPPAAGYGANHLTSMAPPLSQSSGSDFVNTIGAITTLPATIGNAWKHRHDEQKFQEYVKQNPAALYDPMGTKISPEMYGNPYMLRHIQNYIGHKLTNAQSGHLEAEAGLIGEQSKTSAQNRGMTERLNQPDQQELAKSVVNNQGQFPSGSATPANVGFWNMIDPRAMATMTASGAQDRHTSALISEESADRQARTKEKGDETKMRAVEEFLKGSGGMRLTPDQQAEMLGLTIPPDKEAERKKAMADKIDASTGAKKEKQPGMFQRLFSTAAAQRAPQLGATGANTVSQASGPMQPEMNPLRLMSMPQNQVHTQPNAVPGFEQVMEMLRQLYNPMGEQYKLPTLPPTR